MIIAVMSIIQGKNAFFAPLPPLAGYLAELSYKKFVNQLFADLKYSEPLYLKAFYTHEKK